jgi:hypothetical protein
MATPWKKLAIQNSEPAMPAINLSVFGTILLIKSIIVFRKVAKLPQLPQEKSKLINAMSVITIPLITHIINLAMSASVTLFI